MRERPEWYQAVRLAARRAALADDQARAQRKPPFAYRWEHVKQVVRNGNWLLSQVEADHDVVLAACWLHDIAKRKRRHAAAGARYARKFLPDTGFPADKIEAVAAAIEMHEGLFRAAEGWTARSGEPFRAAPPIEPIEAALLWDADKLSKVGPVAYTHFVAFEFDQRARRGRRITTAQLHARTRRWVEEMAPRIIASFNTEAAATKAREFQGAYDQFWRVADDMLALGRAEPTNESASERPSREEMP